MRVGELSSRTDVPVPTIKYYVREGLLPPGRLTSPNQARYDETHVRRLRLIRALTAVGKLPVAEVRKVLAAVDDDETSLHKRLGVAQQSITAEYGEPSGEELDATRKVVAELIERRRWRASPTSQPAEALAVALVAMRQTGHQDVEAALDEWAAASERIAAADLAFTGGYTELESMIEAMVVGSVLGDAALAALRRLAQTDASARANARAGEGEGKGESECEVEVGEAP